MNNFSEFRSGDSLSSSIPTLNSSYVSFDLSRLQVHYQPVVCYNTGTVSSLEALIRYNHPSKGLLYPDSFIDQLQSEISSMGLFKWVLDKTLEHQAYFNLCKINVPISVNTSPDVFLDLSFIPLIKDYISKSSNPLIIELTESTKISSVTTLTHTIDSLKDIHVEVYLDDFGSGFSNHDLIECLPISTVKIDKSLIFRMLDTSEDADLIKSIIALLRKRNIQVVAEGVNSIFEADFLHYCGCYLIQGYGIRKSINHFSIPLWFHKSTLENDWWTRKLDFKFE